MNAVQTTDPQNELFDLYDDTGKPLGASKTRGAVHRDGDWHRSLHLWVWGVDDDQPFVIFQRRSATKDTWPGALDVAVGGHFRSGESLAETLREAEEEIGLNVAETDVVRLGRRFHAWRGDGVHDREINEVYAVRCDWPLDRFRQHPEEIDELAQVNVGDALALFRGDVVATRASCLVRLEQRPRCIQVQVHDFVDASDGYAIATLDAIWQLAGGLKPEMFIIRPKS
jgi:isopentenyldiphosphate isomerase